MRRRLGPLRAALGLILLALPVACDQKEERALPLSAEERIALEAVLRKADSIDSVQYEIHSTVSMPHMPEGGTPPTTAKVWQRIPYMRVESESGGMPSRMIVHPDATYIYNPSLRKFVVAPAGPMGVRNGPKSFKQLSEDILRTPGLKLVGTETVNGEPATVVSYEISGEGGPTTVTLWFSNALGVPLRMSSITRMEDGPIRLAVEYLNYRFEAISDDKFEVPGE